MEGRQLTLLPSSGRTGRAASSRSLDANAARASYSQVEAAWGKDANKAQIHRAHVLLKLTSADALQKDAGGFGRTACCRSPLSECVALAVNVVMSSLDRLS